MHRIFRLALDRREELFDECDDRKEPSWQPLSELRQKILDVIPVEDRHRFVVRRPLQGGIIWDHNNEEEREGVLDEAINGGGVMESLAPVIDLILSQRTHEDHSSLASWIKEDFERSFYSKRARLKVDLVETIDDASIWSVDEEDGYETVLFRDVMAFLNLKERKLLIALRMGKNVMEIAQSGGLSGHASISRRVANLKKKVSALLE